MTLVVVALLIFIIIREVIFAVTIQKLTNKIMSKNYHDYVLAESVPEQIASETKPKTVELNQAEDFNSLMY